MICIRIICYHKQENSLVQENVAQSTGALEYTDCIFAEG